MVLFVDIFNSFEDIFKWIEDIFNSFDGIFNSFEDIFKYNTFEDIFKWIKDIFNSFDDIFNSFEGIFKYLKISLIYLKISSNIWRYLQIIAYMLKRRSIVLPPFFHLNKYIKIIKNLQAFNLLY